MKLNKKKNNKDKSKTKASDIKKNLNEKLDKIADRIPEFLTGNKNSMMQKYAAIYGAEKAECMVVESTRRTGKMYIMLACLLVVIILVSVLKMIVGPEAFMDLSRSSYEGENKSLSAQVEAEYNGKTQKKDAQITILPEGLSYTQKKDRLQQTKKNLGKLILGDNANLNDITSNLNLTTTDPETGVELAWSSGDKSLVDDEGNVNPLIAKQNETVVLDVQLRLDDISDNAKINISFGKPTSGKELSAAISASVNNLIKSLSESDSGDKLALPDKTPEGVNLKWSQSKGSDIIIQIALVILIGVCVYYSRYSSLNKEIKETRESILRDFPDFINKLVLLLNAGLVVTAAFEKISYDYRNRINQDEKRYLYEEFSTMDENIKSSNSGFLTELNDIAQRSGVRDVMRFNTIIVDNIDKGSALVEKLQSESQILWTGRIKMAEEKGRIAETKLTFPMVLQLLVLIIITIAPAAMEM